MGLRKFNVNLNQLATETSLRFDVDFIDYSQIEKNRSYLFGELFDVVEFQKKERLSLLDIIEDIPFKYSEIGNVTKQGDVEAVTLNFSERNELVEDYFKKIEKGDIQKVETGNILLSKVRPNLKKYVLIDDDNSSVYYTTAFIQLRPKKLSKLLYYCFRTIFYEDLMSIARQGKGYPTLKQLDLFCLKIDANVIDVLEKNEKTLISQVEPIEQKIKQLKSKIKAPQEIIDNVIAREFGFDLEQFEALKGVKTSILSFSAFANNKDLRNSVIFHQKSAQFVMCELKRVTSAKLKHFIAEPIVLGASISPSDFNKGGDYYYVSMATVKNYKLELDESQLVTNNYVKNNIKKIIKKNDIIMTRSGVAIGKFALVEDETQGVFADFTMRIRLKNYNPYFAYYYFRSEYFQHLIHSNKKGLQNKNIFPGQIQEFPLLNIPLVEQQRIVDEIKMELDQQDEMAQQIEKERDKIDGIIETCVKERI